MKAERLIQRLENHVEELKKEKSVLQKQVLQQVKEGKNNLKRQLIKLEREKEKIRLEFEQYQKESIKWSVEDFTLCEIDGWEISKSKAQQALENMIKHHDAEWGICWATIRTYIVELNYGRRVPLGKEHWRKVRKEFEQLNKT